MKIRRRDFLLGLGAAAAAPALAGIGSGTVHAAGRAPAGDPWEELRRRFPIDRRYIHLAGLLITAHPQPVSAQIADYRHALDDNPALYLERHNQALEQDVRRAAARYLGVEAADVALTDSTTMGIALVYNGIDVRAGQEMLTTTHDYYSTRTALRYRAARSGAGLRSIRPFAEPREATVEEMSRRVLDAIRPHTRVLALTWVHSWTGVKIPVQRIAAGLREINAARPAHGRVLLCLDGVHGLGVEDETLPALGCDFFMAGTHKWLFGPRGTGVLWGRPGVQDAVTPTIPTFSIEPGWGGRMTPGGFKAFEHRWALAQAFELHREVGRARIADRIHALARRCKEGLAAMPHVRLYTPLDDAVSAGIVSFDVAGLSAVEAVERLARRRIVASVTPYDPPHARFTPGLLNTPAEIDTALEAVDGLRRS